MIVSGGACLNFGCLSLPLPLFEATCGLIFMIDDWQDDSMLVSLEDMESGMSSLRNSNTK